MEQEEKDLLMKDLCGRLPYGVKVNHLLDTKPSDLFAIDTYRSTLYCFRNGREEWYKVEFIKPYLRPLSSMTEKEKDEFLLFFPFCRGDMYFDVKNACVEVFECPHKITLYPFWDNVRLINWLNKNMFDYRGLIPKGLALEAKDGMYNN